MQHKLAGLLLIFASSLGTTAGHAQRAVVDRPNILLMMADDLATEDLSCYGGRRIQTPRLDQLASQGVRLTNYYAGNPVCSPSRMALLSGAYPARLGWRWGVLGYGFPAGCGMSPRVHTLAEALRDAGYRTAMTGKWHLGTQLMGPENQGFDSAFYIPMSNNQNRDMFRDGQLVQKDWDNRRLSEAFAQEAIRVIRQESDRPFFLYLPWSAPHFPADPHPDWDRQSGDDRSARYTDVVRELDYRVGEILDALQAAGKAENTIVVFTSDNGRQKGQQGSHDLPPYSGMKWQSLEGGTRVPCLVRYPGRIEPGTSSPALFAAIDLYPTLVAASEVEIKLPADAQKLDGLNLWETLTSDSAGDRHPRRELLYWHGRGQATALRMGEWKLFFNRGQEDPADPALTEAGPALFHLAEDVRETRNLASQHPERVKAMLHRVQELLTDVYAKQIPLGTLPNGQAPPAPLRADEVWGPWIQ